jgi:hypothetical protein
MLNFGLMTDIPSLIIASGAVMVPVTALLLNHRGFDNLEKSIDKLDHRLELVELDLKDFYKSQAEHNKEIARIKDHTGLK